MDNYTIRKAGPDDLEVFKRLVQEETGLTPNPLMLDRLTNYPSVAAEVEGVVIGLVYTVKFTQDILQMAQILVVPEYRNKGIGEKLVQHLESIVEEPYVSMIVTNTDTYPSQREKKKPATAFYLRNEYHIIAETDDSRVFYKVL